MTIEPSLTTQRRFSSVLIVHPSLQSLGDLQRRLGGRLDVLAPAVVDRKGWNLSRVAFMAGKSHYPKSLVSPESRKTTEGEFPHELYVGDRRDDSNPTCLLIASPYTRLLQQMVGRLVRTRPEPAIQYLGVDMRLTYRLFAQPRPTLSATRVTVQMLNEPGLELVSLTGRNPLHSKLHASISDVTAPYAVRIDVTDRTGARSRVNIDRHGNVWWFQTDEKRLTAPLEVIDLLFAEGALHETRSLPLERAADLGEDERDVT